MKLNLNFEKYFLQNKAFIQPSQNKIIQNKLSYKL